MSTDSNAHQLLFERAGLDETRIDSLVAEALEGADDGELFVEYRQSESLVFDDGRLKSASFDTSHGFGLRAVAGEQTGYAHASELSEAAIRRAGETVRAVHAGHDGTVALAPQGTNRALYMDEEKLELHSGFGKLQNNLAILAESMIDLAAEFASDMRDAAE